MVRASDSRVRRPHQTLYVRVTPISTVPNRSWRVVGAVVLLLVGSVAAIGPFVVEVESTTPEPAPFDDTVSMGLPLSEEYGLEERVALPKAQVFYSQYEYVVGYYGIDTYVDTSREAGHSQQFGYPLAVYVTDYSTVDVELTEEGYPAVAERGEPGWVDAERAWYVHDSEAATPRGNAILPFSDRVDAEAFADARGGTVLAWTDLLEAEFDRAEATVVRDRVDDHRADGDRRVAAAADLRDRPVSTVVGEDADTIQGAIDDAPANTTVRIPAGEYEERLEIDRPLTLVGDGNVTIDGGGNGSVITTTANRTALIDLEITDSGTVQQGSGELPGFDPQEDGDDEEWDATFERNYAGGDAGIAAHSATDSLIENVTIDSEITGIVLRRSGESVVRNVTVHSPEMWEDGHAAILAFRSPIVVENSTVYDGRDAVYSHRSPGLVVRDNYFEGNRLGVHLMHTSDSLVADNRLRNQSNTGIYVMTGPERNAVVGNDISNADYALFPSGSDSYIADNVLTDSRVGLRVDATGTIYERNVVAGNEIGAQTRSMLPTNRVTRNDFVENDVHADAGTGPLRIWTDDGVGNYWQGATALDTAGRDGSVMERSYSPTDPVDRRLHRVDGAETLSRAPALDALEGLQGTVPGMRTGSVVDLAPTCEPNNPDLLERTEWADRAWSCDRTQPTSYGET